MASVTIKVQDNTGEVEVILKAKPGWFRRYDLSNIINKVLDKALPEKTET